MSHTLRTSILATIAAGIMALVPEASAAGRDDWKDYAWQQFDASSCVPASADVLVCPAYHEKWDWKRNQWVDITITIAGHRLRLTQQLTNHDPRDDDHVCVTALVLDARGRDLIAHHQNWHISAGEQLADVFDYASASLNEAKNGLHRLQAMPRGRGPGRRHLRSCTRRNRALNFRPYLPDLHG